MSGSSALVVGCALVVTTVLVALMSAPPVAASTPASKPHAAPSLIAYGECGVPVDQSCSVHPDANLTAKHRMVRGDWYLVVAVVHGPYATPAVVSDSYRDTFVNESYCWLDDGVFGHTQVYASWVKVRAPAHYAVTASKWGSSEWMEVAVVSGHKDLIGPVTNTCAHTNITSSNVTITADYSVSGPSLAVIAWVIGGNSTFTCTSGSSVLLGTCGSSVSGTSYGIGQSWPGLSYVPKTAGGNGTGTISVSGPGCDNLSYCKWADAVVTVTA